MRMAGSPPCAGNGGRCIALFAEHLGIGGATKRFTGIDGVHEARMLEVEGDRGEVALGMIDVPEIDRHDGYCFLNTGSPHYVEFVEDVRSVDVCSRGAAVRWGEPFAAGGGTNVNFVERVGDGHIRVRTFERGVEDETLACGTGATASALRPRCSAVVRYAGTGSTSKGAPFSLRSNRPAEALLAMSS